MLTGPSCRSQERLLVLKTTDFAIFDTLLRVLDRLKGLCPSWLPESALTPAERGTETQRGPGSGACLLRRCTNLLFEGLPNYHSDVE